MKGAVSGSSYESLYRRSAPALLCLLCILVLAGVVSVLAFSMISDSDILMAVVLGVTCATLAAMIIVAVAMFRVHRWTIEADAVRVEERPRVPLFGRRRNAVVALADILALQSIQSGFDSLIEMTGRNGARYRLSQAFRPVASGVGIPDPASLHAFAASIRAAVERGGHGMLPMTDALGFWNRPAGLGVQIVLIALSLAIAGGAAWGIWLGPTVRARGGEMAALLLLLPIGAGWLFAHSLKRRRAVLRAEQGRRR